MKSRELRKELEHLPLSFWRKMSGWEQIVLSAVELPSEMVAHYSLPIHIGKNVWIGSNAVVLPGVTIGDNSIIGAGSVVTRDIPADVVAMGSPCRVLRKITEQDRLQLTEEA